MWDAEVSQVQLHIGLYAKSSYRGFLVAPYDSVSESKDLPLQCNANGRSFDSLFDCNKPVSV